MAGEGKASREHIAARRARHRRVLLLACGLMSLLILLFAGTAWGLATYANNAVGRIFAGTAGGISGPLNVLLAGVDLRAGLTPAQQRALHVGHTASFNSDTLMVIHISADRSSVTVVSLPRDSWVLIPGHGMDKINAAFGLGGPLLARLRLDRAGELEHLRDQHELGADLGRDAVDERLVGRRAAGEECQAEGERGRARGHAGGTSGRWTRGE